MTTQPPATRSSHRIDGETTSAGCRKRTYRATRAAQPHAPAEARTQVSTPRVAMHLLVANSRFGALVVSGSQVFAGTPARATTPPVKERRAIVASLGAPGSVRPSLGVAPNASKRVALRHESPAPVSGRKHPTARAFGPPDLSRNSERSHESRSPHPPAVRPICNLSATGLFLRRRHARFPCTKREGSLDVMATKNPAFAGLS